MIDNLPPRPVASRDRMLQGAFASGRRIVDAKRLIAFVDAVEAVGSADTGADFSLAPFHDLLHDMGVGDMGARHADHVELALGNGMARRGNIVDARRMENGELGRGSYFAGEIEMRGCLHACHGDYLGKGRVMLDMAADDIEKVDQARILEAMADFKAVLAA